MATALGCLLGKRLYTVFMAILSASRRVGIKKRLRRYDETIGQLYGKVNTSTENTEELGYRFIPAGRTLLPYRQTVGRRLWP